MEITAAAVSHGNAERAVEQLLEQAVPKLGGQTPHFGVFTITNHFEDEAEGLVRAVRERTGVETLIGCAGEGVIGPAHEIERQPGMALWLAHLPGVRVRGVHIHPNDLELVDSAQELQRVLRVTAAEQPYFILLADPYFTPYVIGMLEAVSRVYRDRPVFGGMASGADEPGQSVLILNDDVFTEGAVAAVLSGDLTIRSVLSHACRPVGKPFVVTGADGNAIKQLGGKPALEVLTEVFQQATSADRELMNNGIFVGRVISEYKDAFGHGDFLIRNMIGADKDSQVIYLNDIARVGATVQFHVRDPDAADDDLRTRLGRQKAAPAGGLVFSCNGRGTRLYKDADHDIGVIHDVLGEVPMAGLFCAGEIGPVGDQTFVHGYTASIALFGPKSKQGV